jgi:periplasmic divalent cation tolerance protein
VSDVVVVLVTAPSQEVAERLATRAVEARLAACVAALPGIRSVYRWQGAVERAEEVQLVIKTTRDRVDPLRAALLALHPYQVPEVLVLPVVDGLPAYLDWVVAETRPLPPEGP